MDDEVKMPPVLVKIESDLPQRVKELAQKVPAEFHKYVVIVSSQFEQTVKEWDIQRSQLLFSKGQHLDLSIPTIDETLLSNNFKFCLHPDSRQRDSFHYFKFLLSYLLSKHKELALSRLLLSNCFAFRS